MDRLLLQYPYYADAKDRAEAMPRLLTMWQGISDCVAKANVWQTDLSSCVAQVHEACATGDFTDWGQRPCWDDEIFAWKAERQQTRAELEAAIRKNAADHPEYYPKLGPDDDYRPDAMIALLVQYDAAADKIADLTCSMEVGTQGYDPNRGTPSLNAINTVYSCPIDLEAERVWRYLRWKQ